MIWSIVKRFLIATKTPIDTVQCPRHCEDLPKDNVEDAEHTYPGLENITVISMLKGNLIVPVSSYSSNKVLTIVLKHKSLSLVGLRQNQSQSSDKSTSIAGWWHTDDLPGRSAKGEMHANHTQDETSVKLFTSKVSGKNHQIAVEESSNHASEQLVRTRDKKDTSKLAYQDEKDPLNPLHCQEVRPQSQKIGGILKT
ncbi:uncharacterized protein FOMMEDRAFT_162061 [Fomitiporia mediterranea MF3/22]|uniref:uncharacterized protein n=1 Tax=Fomitiporia mediterranea (strain MF3/22) TaxID=694068 RepID=UPI000440907B|nr:uncharacterized protein FOMMEDRAFT_162061 [Fomitiporia mediterranea MF3/22]EJC98294.1 hypothetical protein FOMMEDRAFT_162061 [Fomitiporia mediterranea MF3/22]